MTHTSHNGCCASTKGALQLCIPNPGQVEHCTARCQCIKHQPLHRKAPHKKYSAVKTDDLGGYGTSPLFEMILPENVFLKMAIVLRSLCAVAPSCWHHTSSTASYFICNRKKTQHRSAAPFNDNNGSDVLTK